MKKLLVVLLGLASLNVYANSCGGEYQPATGTCRIIDSSGRQILYNVPSQSNTHTQPKQIIYYDVKVPSKFGALAFDAKSGHIGGALNQNSKAEAQRAAIKQCGAGNKNIHCKVISLVRNGCVAAASGKLNKQTRVIGGAAEQGAAEQNALLNCKNVGMTECKIVMPEGCSLPKFE